MSQELLLRLKELEKDYPRQPLLAQPDDLAEINEIRTKLGMPRVDAKLKEIVVAAVQEIEKPKPPVVETHAEARAIYQAYLKKLKDLAPHQAYATRVARATEGGGQTPVRPLATMGTNGGPLLCDQCEKPIVLEGGAYHGLTADVGWKRNPQKGWKSWILGGMVVEIQTNGTLRIYHGYPRGGSQYCCDKASNADKEAYDSYDTSEGAEKQPKVLAFLEKEFPEMPKDERQRLCKKVIVMMYSYDPGIGVNRPGGTGDNDDHVDTWEDD